MGREGGPARGVGRIERWTGFALPRNPVTFDTTGCLQQRRSHGFRDARARRAGSKGLASGGIDGAARNPAAVRALVDRAIDEHAPDLLLPPAGRVEADLIDDICVASAHFRLSWTIPRSKRSGLTRLPSVCRPRRRPLSSRATILEDEGRARPRGTDATHHSGRRLDLSSPFVDATLAGGERLHVVIPPVTGVSWSVNIRQHISVPERSATSSRSTIAPPMRNFLACRRAWAYPLWCPEAPRQARRRAAASAG